MKSVAYLICSVVALGAASPPPNPDCDSDGAPVAAAIRNFPVSQARSYYGRFYNGPARGFFDEDEETDTKGMSARGGFNLPGGATTGNVMALIKLVLGTVINTVPHLKRLYPEVQADLDQVKGAEMPLFVLELFLKSMVAAISQYVPEVKKTGDLVFRAWQGVKPYVLEVMQAVWPKIEGTFNFVVSNMFKVIVDNFGSAVVKRLLG